MAVNYSPNEVSFILIDYKGGGLAGAFNANVLKELTSVSQKDNDALWKAAEKAYKTSPLINKKVRKLP